MFEKTKSFVSNHKLAIAATVCVAAGVVLWRTGAAKTVAKVAGQAVANMGAVIGTTAAASTEVVGAVTSAVVDNAGVVVETAVAAAEAVTAAV